KRIRAQHSPGQRLTEIADAIGIGRNRDGLIVDVLRITVLFEVEKEERLVVAVVRSRNVDGASECETEIVAADPWFRMQPWMTCIERFVCEVLVATTVHLVGSGLDGVVQEAAAHLTILSGEVAR